MSGSTRTAASRTSITDSEKKLLPRELEDAPLITQKCPGWYLIVSVSLPGHVKPSRFSEAATMLPRRDPCIWEQ
jgi:hypothetical protein